jgi:hypothetical protein
MRTRKSRRRYRRNPTGTQTVIVVGGGVLALFGAYKAYSNYQTAKDADDKRSAADISANKDALAQWTKVEDDAKMASWTWGGVSLIGGVIAALAIWK